MNIAIIILGEENMLDRCKTNTDCYEEHKKSVRFINGRWIIGILCFIIFLLLTYGFWGKPYPIQDLISVGMGFSSIFLAVFAIFYSFTENLKTNQKESRVDNLLYNIENSVNTVHKVLNQVQEIANTTNTKVGMLEALIRNAEKQTQYETKDEEQEKIRRQEQEDPEQRPEQEQPSEQKQIRRLSNIKRGDIYYATLDENNSYRPVIVISNAGMLGQYSPVVVIPITSNFKKAKFPTHVVIDTLEMPAVALVELVSTIKQSQLKEHVSSLNASVMDDIEKALMLVVGKHEKSDA